MPHRQRTASADLLQPHAPAPQQTTSRRPDAHRPSPLSSLSLSRQHSRSTASPSSPSPSPSHSRLPLSLSLPSRSSRSSHGPSSPSTRRASNPTTPTLTPAHPSSSSTATSPSYFSPQPAASGKDARSPASRKPPAFFSGHGIDASRGPPNSLITRGNVDIARPAQNPADFAFAQQQLIQAGLASPASSSRRPRRVSSASTHSQTPTLSRHNSAQSAALDQRELPMDSSVDGSEYSSARYSHANRPRPTHNGYGDTDTSGTDAEQEQDLFIAAAHSPPKNDTENASRTDRLRSRIAVRNHRQSFPLGPQTGAQTDSRIPPSIDTSATVQPRRASYISTSSRLQREPTPASPSNVLDTPRSRRFEISPKPPSPKIRDQDLSPHQFLSQLSKRRPSYSDATHTPPNRAQAYRPSNLHYSSSRDPPTTPHAEIPQEVAFKADGTESLDDSTGAPASVWDELDELKSRIRRIELGGKIPTTSGAAVANASADRPRTANTSVTTVSSSPRQQRKGGSPAASIVGVQTPHRVHPLLKEALAKTRQHLAPAAYRALEATAAEAMALAELAGSAGPQGTLHNASSILSGALVPDRQVRRKADNLCRNLTDLCIELCDAKAAVSSPAVRASTMPTSRRPSVQINGDSPIVRQSIEAESDTLTHSSPSRAMSRIEMRRTSQMNGRIDGYARGSSQEPGTPSQSHVPSRFDRAGTSLHRSRRTVQEDDVDEPTLRAPSRAMTDFQNVRHTDQTKRFSREYTSRVPLPDLQPSPAMQTPASLRRPTVPGIENNNLLFRDNSRRYIERQSSPAYERQISADLSNRLSQPSHRYDPKRASIGGITDLSRSGSLKSRRARGASTGE